MYSIPRQERRRRSAARIGGLSLHAQGDSEAIAARARRGLERKFVNEALSVDPSLTGERLERKVATIRRLYDVRLGRLSAKSRTARRRSSRLIGPEAGLPLSGPKAEAAE